MLRAGLPLTRVQRILGHESAGQTMPYKDDSRRNLAWLMHHYALVEQRPRTSARNVFTGFVKEVVRGPVMCEVVLETPAGHSVSALITGESLEALGLDPGIPVRATVKAALVDVAPADHPGATSARNRFTGTVATVKESPVVSEVVVRLDDGHELCALVTTRGLAGLQIAPGRPATVCFKALSVVLQLD